MRRGLSQQFRAGLPQWLSSKESACNAGDTGSIPGSGRSLEEGMAIHSRILARKIPGTEETRRLQSMVLQRVRHDLMTTHACMPVYYLRGMRQILRALFPFSAMFNMVLFAAL